jgi:basic amino acid/polyamine antiporter, APA family
VSGGAPTPAATLRRAMSLRTAVSTSTGLAFAALQYLAAAGLVTYVAGDSAWISIAVAGGLALLAWAFFGELNGMFPTAAAIRRYMSGAMDDRVALSITFTYLSTIVLVVAADAFIVGAALTHVLHAPGWVTAVWTLVLLAVAVVSNLRGVKVAGWLQDVATSIVLLATLVVSVVALTRSDTPLRTPFQPLHHHSGAGFVESVALGIFLYSAFEWVTTNAEEVRDPKHIHRAMLIAVGILFAVCAAMTTAMSHVLTHAQLSTAYPQLSLGERAFGTAGLWFMAGITAVTALNTFNGGFITASRFVYATAREGSLPPILARLNDRAVPWVPVIVLGATSFVVSVVVELVGGSGWQVLVAVGAALEGMIYAVAAFCVLRLRGRAPEHHRPFRIPWVRIVAVAGIAVFGILAVVASVSVANRFNPLPLVIILVMGAASAAYTVRVVPRLQAAEAARRSARPTRRRPPRPAAGDPPAPAPPTAAPPSPTDVP